MRSAVTERGRPGGGGGRAVHGFYTKSGKVEFLSAGLADRPDAEGRPVDPLPAYRPRDWQPDSTYSLFLIS